jgi:hypothetical protein
VSTFTRSPRAVRAGVTVALGLALPVAVLRAQPDVPAIGDGPARAEASPGGSSAAGVPSRLPVGASPASRTLDAGLPVEVSSFATVAHITEQNRPAPDGTLGRFSSLTAPVDDHRAAPVAGSRAGVDDAPAAGGADRLERTPSPSGTRTVPGLDDAPAGGSRAVGADDGGPAVADPGTTADRATVADPETIGGRTTAAEPGTAEPDTADPGAAEPGAAGVDVGATAAGSESPAASVAAPVADTAAPAPAAGQAFPSGAVSAPVTGSAIAALTAWNQTNPTAGGLHAR